MQHFEIINGKWIKQIDFSSGGDLIFKSLRIDSIVSFDTRVWPGGTYFIHLRSSDKMELNIRYEPNETELYKNDLAYFEKLLF